MIKEILVCKVENVSFTVAEKNFEKVIKDDFFEVDYPEITKTKEGAKEVGLYQNLENDRTFKVVTNWIKEGDKHSLAIYELIDQKEIKVIKVNGDHFNTLINGTQMEIIEHYNRYNLECDNKENFEVKEIHFLYNDGGFSKTMERKVIYNFEHDKKLNCYQY